MKRLLAALLLILSALPLAAAGYGGYWYDDTRYNYNYHYYGYDIDDCQDYPMSCFGPRQPIIITNDLYHTYYGRYYGGGYNHYPRYNSPRYYEPGSYYYNGNWGIYY